jgi:hypothetical protein
LIYAKHHLFLTDSIEKSIFTGSVPPSPREKAFRLVLNNSIIQVEQTTEKDRIETISYIFGQREAFSRGEGGAAPKRFVSITVELGDTYEQ